jgi:uncharacterized protein (TIGR03000 family)
MLVVADSANAQRGNRWGWGGYGGYGYDRGYYGGGYYGPSYSGGPIYGAYYGGGTIYPETIINEQIVSSDPSMTASVLPAPSPNQVLLNINVPDPNARLWIENQEMTAVGGPQRLFQSPPLEPGREYTYTIRASWMNNGREVSDVKKFDVRGGQTLAADFGQQRPANAMAANAAVANINVTLPDPSARLWIENQQMSVDGTQRSFQSPPLDPGRAYTYTVRAAWLENGREVSDTKTLNIQAGQTVAANFADRGAAVASAPPTPGGNNAMRFYPTPRGSRESTAQQEPATREGALPRPLGTQPATQSGKVVSVGNGALTFTDHAGNRQVVQVTPGTTITCDGKECKLEDLKEGFPITINARNDAARTAARIDATSLIR